MAIVEITTAQTEVKQSRWKAFWSSCLEVTAILFWVYAITKLFVFDIDVYLLSSIDPSILWILHYKLLAILLLIVVVMLATRSITLGLAVAYIAFYPFIILIWKIPRFVWGQQNWLLAFAIVNAAISLFYSFRRTFITGTFFLVCTVVILTFSNKYLLYGSAIFIAVIIALAYYFAFLKAFKPSAVFQIYTKLFPAIRNSNFLKTDSSVRNQSTDSLNDQQIQLRTNSLQNVVLFNRTCLFVSKKLRDYQRSGVGFVSYIVNLVFLLIFTVFSFSLINYTLFKLNPSAYQFTYSQPSFFSFIYYSGGSMFYAANGLAPVAPIAQAIQLAQFLCAVLLLVILLTVVVALRNEKYAFELERIITSVEREGRGVEGLLRSEYNLDNVDAAIDALQKAKAGLAALIIYLTNNLGECNPFSH